MRSERFPSRVSSGWDSPLAGDSSSNPAHDRNSHLGRESQHHLRIELVSTLVERYYVTEKAIGMVPEGADRDDFLIELFEQHNGSVYCDDLFCHDANNSVGCKIEEVDPDA